MRTRSSKSDISNQREEIGLSTRWPMISEFCTKVRFPLIQNRLNQTTSDPVRLPGRAAVSFNFQPRSFKKGMFMKNTNAVKSAILTAAVGFMALGATATSAFAATPVSTTFAVTATVQATCVVSATSMVFGTYTGLVAASSSTVSVTCTNTTPYNVGLDAGLAGGTVATRSMKSGAVLLNYKLTRDAAFAQNWGITSGTDTSAGTGNGSAQAITVYGQVPAGQYVTPGAYTDSITATVTY